MNTSTITIHMVCSLDGFIANKDNTVSWFETTDKYEQGADEPDVSDFLKTIDCYVMGSRTYQHAEELSKSYGWPYGDIPTTVLSHRTLDAERKNISVYSGDLNTLVNEHLGPRYKNIWVVGGSIVVNEFIRLGLVDEIRVSIIPIILGGGTPFFISHGQEQPLHLKEVTGYKNGLVNLRYQIRK